MCTESKMKKRICQAYGLFSLFISFDTEINKHKFASSVRGGDRAGGIHFSYRNNDDEQRPEKKKYCDG